MFGALPSPKRPWLSTTTSDSGKTYKLLKGLPHH